MVLWKFPPSFSWLLHPTSSYPWLVQLGDRGPWLVDRVIGAREMPAGLDTAGKVDVIAHSVLRACANHHGEANVEIHNHVTRNVRSWASDGADMSVGHACTSHFQRMVFREWEESHSANKLLEHAIKNHEGARRIDGLLVSGVDSAPRLAHATKSPSLAKFLTTSEVFRKRCTAAQSSAGIALCENFGYAPQRYVSRARPMSRVQRRWDPIWDSLAEEAVGNSKRAPLARFFLNELGGENSARLLFGGMITDMAAEHYEWVAGGDKGNPDPASSEGRTALFLERLSVLFDEGMVVTLPDTYTGQVLEFLRKGKVVHTAKSVHSCGLCRLSDVDVHGVIAQALRNARELVAIIRAYVPVYRNKSGWLHAFAAFRLPSPLSDTAAVNKSSAEAKERATEVTEIHASLDRIVAADGLGESAKTQLLELLPRAELHYRSGRDTKAAWGNASAEFPEYIEARSLVNLYLIWKPNTGNLERRFRDKKEHNCPERCRLLDTTVENLMLVDCAPSSKLLRLASSGSAPGTPLANTLTKNTDSSTLRRYFRKTASIHCELHGKRRRQSARKRKEQRNKGVPKSRDRLQASRAKSGAPIPEAEFKRRRAAAINEVVHSARSQRAKVMGKHVLGDVAAAVAAEVVVVPADLQTKINKRVAEATSSYDNGAEQAKRAREALAHKSARSFVGARGVDAAHMPSAPAGVALVRGADTHAHRLLTKSGFKTMFNPLDFVEQVLRVRSRAPRRGHLVLVPHGIHSDFIVSARIAASTLGTHLASPEDYLAQGASCGCSFGLSYNVDGPKLHVAVSAAFASLCPTAPKILLRLAQAPRSRLEFHRSVRKVEKRAKKQVLRTAWKTCRILSTADDLAGAKSKYQSLYANTDDFLRMIQKLARELRCPGFDDT